MGQFGGTRYGREGRAERGALFVSYVSVKYLTQTNNYMLGWASWVGLRIMWAMNEVVGVGSVGV